MKTILVTALAFVMYSSPVFAQATNTFPATGNAGIGTLSPVAAIDVHGSGFFEQDSGGLSSGTGVRIFYDGTAGEIYTYDFTNNAWKNVLLASGGGNVGIGTTSPANLLDIGTGGGIHITSGTPSSTTNALYNNSGTLAWNGVAVSGAAAAISSGGQLQCSGANCSNSTGSSTLKYCPYKGNVKTTASQGNYSIPSACLSATLTSMYVGGTASSSVVASTLYYIYLWNTSGTWVLDAETTGHATDSTTGIEIMSGDNTKTLVGMIHTDGNKHVKTGGATTTGFKDTNTVATWDNRIPTSAMCGFTATRTSTNSSWGEVNSENRCYFMSWGDAAQFNSNLMGYGSTTSCAVETAIYVDSVSGPEPVEISGYTPGDQVPVLTSGTEALTEGYHYTVLAALVPATCTSTYIAGGETVYSVQ